MAKGKTTAYRPLSVRRKYATNMTVIVACLFGVLVLTGITGHLFSRRETTTTSAPQPKPHHEALAKLIRTSEDAIGWIGNKTIDSINNIKNLTASAVTPESPLVVKKNKFINWLGRVVHYNNSASGAAESTEGSEDSGERVVIAHRTPDNGFSWGPPKENKCDENDSSSKGLIHAAGRRVHNVLTYLYQTSRNITQRGKDILQSGIDKVKTAKESLRTRLLKKNETLNGMSTITPTPAATVGEFPCDDVVENVCAVDWSRNTFAIFQNDCWVRVYNQRHGTNFSIQDNDVCTTLFSQNPENYLKIDNSQL